MMASQFQFVGVACVNWN